MSTYVYIQCSICNDFEQVPDWVATENDHSYTCDLCQHMGR